MQLRGVKYARLVDAEAAARIAKTDADGRTQMLREEVERVSQPVGVGLGILVLASFAALGIVFPVIVMANQPAKVAPWLRGMVVAAFGVGLITVLGYIVWLFRRVRAGTPSR
jgi:hypothetical protein